MNSILPFDEINRLEASIRAQFADGKRPSEEDIIDEMLDLFLLAYANGVEVTNENLASDWQPDPEEVFEVVDAEIAGKTWRERVKDYYQKGGNAEDFVRIVETETHRNANTGALTAAKHGGAKTKTWITMLDEKVRDSHSYLESVTIGIDDEFITFDGDHASAPGLFSLASNNVNCRCELLFR